MKSTIRLFKAVPITKEARKKATKNLLKQTIQLGFIFSPEVIYNYSEKDLLSMIRTIKSEIGLTPEQMNSSFHKSWKKIKEASIEQLVLEQIIHYITTYGFESLEIYDKDSVYIPSEKLKIPEIKTKKIRLVVIKGYTKEELKSKLLHLLKIGIALNEDTKKDVIDVALFVELSEREISDSKNKEVRIALYDYLDLFPKNPIEFLRFLIYKSTNKTLLIKNKATIEDIKSKDNLSILSLLIKYDRKYGLEELAEIFYRFKPLFLAFRSNGKLKTITNRIRKLAIKHHKPMKEDYLNTITAKLKNGERIIKTKLKDELDKVNMFRKIRLAYALKFRTKNVDSILYRIRNGKSYATDFKFNNQITAKAVLDAVIDSIVKDIKVKGKKIYIPNNINYTLPSTEKQFTGNFPSGTSVVIPKDMIFGVHWENVGEHRIDLDLSMLNSEDGKIGWDSYYRTADRDILFSGDITDAPKPNGASELFYVKNQRTASFILFVNYYNHEEDVEVPFKILVASKELKSLNQNYMVNPNDVITICKSIIKERQKILGLVSITPEKCKFYFTEAYIGNSITSFGSDFAQHARKYLFDFYENSISLNEILEKAGAKIFNDKNKQEKCDIDLSPETIEKDTILNLLTK